MPLTDTELMLRIQAGDEDSFRELMNRYAMRVLSFFQGLGLQPSDAEDAVQEVFSRLYRSRDDFVPKARFRSYLYRIATNYWIDRYRSQKRGPRVFSLDAPIGNSDSAGTRTLKNEIAADQRKPDRSLRDRELSDKIALAIKKLPEGQRVVFALAVLVGVRYREISKMLGVPVGTVKSRMHTAVNQLRESLSREVI